MHPFKPWLNRNYKRDTLFVLKTDYIINHLDRYDYNKIFSNNQWQDTKETKVIQELDKGKHPLSFQPIRVVLHTSREQFRIEDGISRLRAFKRKNKPKIKVLLRFGDW